MKIPKPSPLVCTLPVGEWAPQIPVSDLVKIVQKIHASPQDFDEGDLMDRLYKFDMYQLQELPLDTLDAFQWSSADWMVDEYAALSTQAPPIVYDPKQKSIIDGTHRALAAIAKGQTHILAYVGVLSANSD